MQMILVLFGCASSILFQMQGCDLQRPSRSLLQNQGYVTPSPPRPDKYSIAGSDCFSDETCLTFVSIDKKSGNEEVLTRLSNLFSKKNPNKKTLVVYFFEDSGAAKAFAQGKIPPRDLDFYAVGAYRYDDKEEYLKLRIITKNEPEPPENRPEWRVVFSRPRSE